MVRAVLSPIAVLTLLLVESIAGHLLAAAPVWRIVLVSSMITKAAAGWSWGLGIKNLSFVMCVAHAWPSPARSTCSCSRFSLGCTPGRTADLADEHEHVERAGLGHVHPRTRGS